MQGRLIAVALLALAVAGRASAQDSLGHAHAGEARITTGVMSEAVVRQRLVQLGYTPVEVVRRPRISQRILIRPHPADSLARRDRAYQIRARKGGRPVTVEIDALLGTVSERRE